MQRMRRVAQRLDHTRAHTVFTALLPRLMLLAAAAIWGSTYTISKFAMEAVTPQWLLAMRTLAGAAALGLVCRRRFRRAISMRLLVLSTGVALMYYVAFLAQMKGLTLISPGRSAFLSALYCVIIPLIQWAMRRHSPGLQHMVSAGVCLLGVWLVSQDSSPAGSGSTTSVGDLLTIGCAVAFAVYFYALGVLSLSMDPLVLTFIIFSVSGVLFLAGALLSEPWPRQLMNHAQAAVSVGYLIVAAVCAQVLQNIGLVRTSAMEASIILSTDTLFALAISMTFFGERPGRNSLLGFLCIFAAVLITVLHRDPHVEGKLPSRPS